jgi:hypothetical protein
MGGFSGAPKLGGFSGMPRVKKPRLPLRAKLSVLGKLRSFIGKGAFGKSSTGQSGKVKQPNFTKGL